MFDSQGRRIAEYNEGTGALIREYVWMGWEPIAVIEGGVVSFIRTDHIGRPVFATNTTGTKVWTASYTPFGGVRTTTGTPINARFPGQWFQSESGLHQNWMRDYDPTTGRYLQADPLGLVDGASVYGYAGQSPMMYTDTNGMRSLRLGGTTGGYSPSIGPGSPTAPDYSWAWDELLGLSHDYNPIDLALQGIVEYCTSCPAYCRIRQGRLETLVRITITRIIRGRMVGHILIYSELTKYHKHASATGIKRVPLVIPHQLRRLRWT